MGIENRILVGGECLLVAIIKKNPASAISSAVKGMLQIIIIIGGLDVGIVNVGAIKLDPAGGGRVGLFELGKINVNHIHFDILPVGVVVVFIIIDDVSTFVVANFGDSADFLRLADLLIGDIHLNFPFHKIISRTEDADSNNSCKNTINGVAANRLGVAAGGKWLRSGRVFRF